MLDSGLGIILDFFKILISTLVDTLKTFMGFLPKILSEMRKVRK